MSSVSLHEILAITTPDPKKAAKHADEFTLRDPEGRPLKICDSSPVDLGAGGVGVEMYFVYLKQMIILFTIMTAISLPVVIINYLGGYLNEVEKTSPFEASTIANQKGIPPGITNKTEAEKTIEEHKTYMYTTVGLDVLYCVAYIVLVFFYEWYNRKRINASKNLSVCDFSVMAELPPGSNVTTEDLKKFFEKYGPVHECTIPKYYGQSLEKIVEYSNVEKTLLAEKRKPKEDAEKIDLLKTQRKAMLEQLKADAAANTDASKNNKVISFVIFETIKSKEECLKDYSKWKNLHHTKNEPQGLRCNGLPVAVNKAPEPSEIAWENLGVKKRSWKILLIYLAITVTVLLSFVVISIVEYYENRLPTYSRCLEFEAPVYTLNNATITNETLYVQQVLCFCGGMEETKIEERSDYNEFCQKYWSYFFQIWVVRLAGLGLVALISMLLKYAIMGIFFLPDFHSI